MITVHVLIQDSELIPDDYTVGHAGDHLATQLSIVLPVDWQGYYYRLRFHTSGQSEEEAFLSDDLAASNNTIVFPLPSGLMVAGKLDIQLEAKQNDTVVHTASMSMFVGESLGSASGDYGLPPNYAGLVDKLFDDVHKEIENTANETADWLSQQAALGYFNGKKGDDGHGLSILGIYGTLAELQAAHPKGECGDAFAIGTAAANDLFVWNEIATSWQNIGNVLGGWTMNDLCVDAGDWNADAGGWMMDSLCMDAGDWTLLNGNVTTLAEHEVDADAHSNLIVDGNIS